MKKNEIDQLKLNFQQYLKDKGLACTSQRDAIIEHLVKETSHFNADTFVHSLQKKHLPVSRATVYRTLQHLEDAGIIREVAINTSQAYYEFTGRTTHHEHLVCENCGTIIEFVDDQLEERIEQIARLHHLSITRHTVQISGYCRSCHEKQ